MYYSVSVYIRIVETVYINNHYFFFFFFIFLHLGLFWFPELAFVYVNIKFTVINLSQYTYWALLNGNFFLTYTKLSLMHLVTVF